MLQLKLDILAFLLTWPSVDGATETRQPQQSAKEGIASVWPRASF
jgi:hypothetical protein